MVEWRTEESCRKMPGAVAVRSHILCINNGADEESAAAMPVPSDRHGTQVFLFGEWPLIAPGAMLSGIPRKHAEHRRPACFRAKRSKAWHPPGISLSLT